jgi:hypothetical protein
MKKFDYLGKSLTKAEQKHIKGGTDPYDDGDGGEGGYGCSQNMDFCGTNNQGHVIKCCPEEHATCIDNLCQK